MQEFMSIRSIHKSEDEIDELLAIRDTLSAQDVNED